MNPSWIFAFIWVLIGFAHAQCVRDSYANLPGLPQHPTTPYPGNPPLFPANTYVQNHWSEMANIGSFRPQKDPNTLAGGIAHE